MHTSLYNMPTSSAAVCDDEMVMEIEMSATCHLSFAGQPSKVSSLFSCSSCGQWRLAG